MSTNIFYSNKYQYSKQELYLHVADSYIQLNVQNFLFYVIEKTEYFVVEILFGLKEKLKK